MLTKILRIRLLMFSSNFDFLAVNDTWLKDHTSQNALTSPGDKSFRKSRQTQQGSSCPVYGIESIPTTLGQDPKLNTQDAVWVRAETGNEGLLIGRVYCPQILIKMIFRGLPNKFISPRAHQVPSRSLGTSMHPVYAGLRFLSQVACFRSLKVFIKVVRPNT